MGHGFRVLFSYIKRFVCFIKGLFNKEKKEEVIENNDDEYDDEEEYEERPGIIERIRLFF